jgi:hypothetical protein
MPLCSVKIYVRRGALLVKAYEALGVSVWVDQGEIPIIHMRDHDWTPRTLRWDGQAFQWQ